MKYYTWIEPDFDENDNYKGPVTMIWSSKQILNSYWNCWYNDMVAKYGEGHELIHENECINDFVVCHWAVECDKDGKVIN